MNQPTTLTPWQRLIAALQAAVQSINSLGAMRTLAIWSLVTLLLVAWINPSKLGVYAWMVSKLTIAAVLGFATDRAAFPDAHPSELQGIEQNLAYTRRATMIAAFVIAAGLMP